MLETAASGHARRLGAIIYDAFLLCAVLFFAGALFIALAGGDAMASPIMKILLQFYLLGVCFAFYGWFWVHGGQTLGLRAWRLRVVRHDRAPITWRHAALRFASAILSWAALGLGFLWIYIDPQCRAWHDRLSGTRVVLEPRK